MKMDFKLSRCIRDLKFLFSNFFKYGHNIIYFLPIAVSEKQLLLYTEYCI